MTNQAELKQNNQELEILNWLKNNAPEVFKDQKHLDEGTSERAYWHYGRWSALKDTRTSPTPPSSAGEREAFEAHIDKEGFWRAMPGERGLMKDGFYVDPHIQKRWQDWQARSHDTTKTEQNMAALGSTGPIKEAGFDSLPSPTKTEAGCLCHVGLRHCSIHQEAEAGMAESEIEKYLAHFPSCEWLKTHSPETSCTCGLDNALSTMQPQAKVMGEDELSEVIVAEIKRQNLAEDKDVGRVAGTILLGVNEGIMGVSRLAKIILAAQQKGGD